MMDKVTVNEIRETLGISRPAVYKMLKNRVIPSIRFGKTHGGYLIPRKMWEQWLIDNKLEDLIREK